MKKNKGFTLVEILVVIVILGIAMIIAIPSINDSRNIANEKAYATKASGFESAAVLYTQDNMENLVNAKTSSDYTIVNSNDSKVTATIKLSKLIEHGYLMNSDDALIDPRNQNDLSNSSVVITIDKSTNKIEANYIGGLIGSSLIKTKGDYYMPVITGNINNIDGFKIKIFIDGGRYFNKTSHLTKAKFTLSGIRLEQGNVYYLEIIPYKLDNGNKIYYEDAKLIIEEIDNSFNSSSADGKSQSNKIKVYKGDVNFDGGVSYEDASIILKMCVGNVAPTEAQVLLADIDGDGYTSSNDALLAMLISMGDRTKEIFELDASTPGAINYILPELHNMYQNINGFITVYKGDINHDAVISSSNDDDESGNDGQSILRIIVQTLIPTPAQRLVADVDDDSTINTNDAMFVMQMASRTREKETIQLPVTLEGASDYIIPELATMYR